LGIGGWNSTRKIGRNRKKLEGIGRNWKELEGIGRNWKGRTDARNTCDLSPSLSASSIDNDAYIFVVVVVVVVIPW